MVTKRARSAIDKMAQERERFITWVRSVPSDDWPKLSPDGMWQARDYVAHLASIDPLLTRLIRTFQQEGGAADGRDSGRRFSIDEWNEGKILKRRTHSIEELIAEMEKYRGDLGAAMAAFSDEQLDRTFHFGGDKSRSPRDLQVGEFLRGLVYHDRWHMEDARRAIEGESEQPFGDEAFSKMLQSDPSLTA
jgi:hypothetical protein